MKFCKDCKYFKELGDFSGNRLPDDVKTDKVCSYPDIPKEPIYGCPVTTAPSVLRSGNFNCGPNGEWWESKE